MKLIVSLVVLLAVAGCVTDSSGHNPKTCEQKSKGDPFSGGGVTPAVDEGNGFVSFVKYSFTDTLDGSDDFFLVQCSTGKSALIVQENTDYYTRDDLGEGSTRTRHTLLSLIEELRSSGKLNDLNATIRGGKAAKFPSSLAVANQTSESATCACQSFYPDTAIAWADGEENTSGVTN